ncbi:MAG: hypothetical protein OEY09_19835 [Gammaproteobacteria bacterium]|nr:hypothetical protein [Gammaproteobacteria bacterium]
MSTPNLTSSNNLTTTYTEQPVSAPEHESNDLTIGFFAIGMAINIIMITAYFIWAYRQWGKSNKKDE